MSYNFDKIVGKRELNESDIKKLLDMSEIKNSPFTHYLLEQAKSNPNDRKEFVEAASMFLSYSLNACHSREELEKRRIKAILRL